jgi:hypothetical protein
MVTYASGAMTLAANYTAATAFSEMQARYGNVRCVGACMDITPTGPALYSKGYAVVGQFSGNTTVQATGGGGTFAATDVFGHLEKKETFPADKSIRMLYIPQAANDLEFFPLGTSTAFAKGVNVEAPILVACFTGLDATYSSYSVALTMNYEVTFGQALISHASRSELATPAVPGWFEKTKNAIASIPQFVSGASDIYNAGAAAWKSISGAAGAIGRIGARAAPIVEELEIGLPLLAL